LLSAADLQNVPHERIFKLYREHSLTKPYDYEHHIALSESLESCRQCGHIHTGDKRCTNPVVAEGCLIKSNPCECKVQGGILPTTFMLLQPQSWHPDVWTDIARMRSLNALQSSSGKEMHLCPLQFDICDRVINQFTMPEETVLDPFGGLMTVPYCAVKLGRKGIGIELSPTYWRDGVSYLKAVEKRADSPTLFDLVEAEAG
jgi:DNA modification methylase